MLKTLSFQYRSTGSIPGQGTRSHMPQLRVHVSRLKILHATAKSGHKLKNKQKRISIKHVVKYNKLRKIAQEYFTWTKRSCHQTETTQNLSKMLKEKGGGGDRGRGAGRRDRKVCRELGENHTPHVGTDVDTPGPTTGEIHFWLL